MPKAFSSTTNPSAAARRYSSSTAGRGHRTTTSFPTLFRWLAKTDWYSLTSVAAGSRPSWRILLNIRWRTWWRTLKPSEKALGLGKINLLGHSCGGVLAQAYALKYQQNLDRLVLCSTFHSTSEMNEVFKAMKAQMPRELRKRIDKLEAAGLYGHGKDYEKNRYPSAYMAAAWGEGYFPYLYQKRPDANFDPNSTGNMAWDVYREMWGSHGEFVIDGNLTSVEYAGRLPSIKVPTLIAVGDHDECAPSLSREMNTLIAGSKLVVLPESGHMTFVDQPRLFLEAVQSFLSASK